jgi:TolA-binding protein
MVLKVAMCLAASKNSDMAITAMEVEVAVGLLTALEENMLFAYSGGSGDSGPRTLSDRILQYLKEKGSATRTDLTKQFHYRIQKAEELKEAVETLIQAELIRAEKRDAPEGKGMKPTQWFHYIPEKKGKSKSE